MKLELQLKNLYIKKLRFFIVFFVETYGKVQQKEQRY